MIILLENHDAPSFSFGKGVRANERAGKRARVRARGGQALIDRSLWEENWVGKWRYLCVYVLSERFILYRFSRTSSSVRTSVRPRPLLVQWLISCRRHWHTVPWWLWRPRVTKNTTAPAANPVVLPSRTNTMLLLALVVVMVVGIVCSHFRGQ